MNSLLEELPLNTLGYPLSSFWKILVYFVIPPSLTLILYLTIISSDIGLVCWHIAEGNPRWGTVTLIFMFAPPIAGFIFTLASPDRWPSENPTDRENLRFLGLNLWHLVFFPFAAVYRYVHQIFWSIEAICADVKSQIDRRENALRILMKPNSFELYFFLQAYLHSAPQIFFQFMFLLEGTTSKDDIGSLQITSIVTSLIRMAITTAAYQRFERRKVLGVYYPWASKKVIRLSKHYSELERNRLSKMTIASSEEEPLNEPDEPVVKPLWRRSELIQDEIFEEPIPSTHTANVQLDPFDHFYERNKVVNDDVITKASSSSSVFEEPIPNNEVVVMRKHVSIIESPESDSKRASNDSNLKERVVDMSKHVTPPATPAPRPMSIVAIRERIKSNADFIVEQIPQRRHRDDLELPVRVRRSAIKGVEQEDGVSKFIAIIAWFFFITARMIVLVTFCYFYTTALIGVCVAHYVLGVICLMLNSWSESVNRKFFYLFLGYVYLFCLLEFKMKFRKVRIWYGGFFSLVFIENFILTTIWYWTVELTSWWYKYLVVFILGSSTLSYMCFFLYILILKPKPVTIYSKIPNEGISPATL